jgi:hypothetical protein
MMQLRTGVTAWALILALLIALVSTVALADGGTTNQDGNDGAKRFVEYGSDVDGSIGDDSLPDISINRKTPVPEPTPAPEPSIIKPNKDFYYYDEVGVLSEELKGEIYFTNERLYRDCGAQIVVVVLPTTGAENIEDYSIRLFNSWGIGDSQRNNGFLLLFAINDENYYACPGTGLREALPSEEISRMLSDNLEGDFAARKYDSGVRKTYEALFLRIASICGSDVTIQEGMDAYTRYCESP